MDNEGGLYDVEKKNKVGSGLKLTLWKREDKNENQNEKNPVKWMSSKIKASDQTILEKTTNNSTYIKLKLEDQKQQPSYPLETDYSSNNSNNNIPIRVCADCNTTKTPLWRSGPKGPKVINSSFLSFSECVLLRHNIVKYMMCIVSKQAKVLSSNLNCHPY